MKCKLFQITLLLLLFSTFACVFAKAPDGHFYDVKRNHLEPYDYLYNELTKFFGNKVPDRIVVKYTNEGTTSKFNVNDNSVLILESSAITRAVPVIGHESCHLSMARFTKGASVKEVFRFFDEGFASVFEHMLANDSDKYKKTVLRIAAQQNQKDNVNFVKVQKWSEYFGNPNIAINGYAYPVGASFVYYLSDTYGMDFFLSFCKDIGDTYDLDQSCRNIFKQNRNTIEAGWKEYLRNVPLPGPPRIVKMFPENGATQVSLKTTEICVEFDVPMAKRIVVISNGNGVSYKNAYWKTERILAVKVGLMPSHVYQISLGSSSGNRLLSEDNVELPPTPWSFTTGLE